MTCKKHWHSKHNELWKTVLQRKYSLIEELSERCAKTSTQICENTGWPKSCDPNVQAYCGLIIYAINLNLPEMNSFRQPFEDFTKIAQKFVYFFFHFRSFRSFSAISDQSLLLIHITSCLASRILLTLKKWELYIFSDDWDIKQKARFIRCLITRDLFRKLSVSQGLSVNARASLSSCSE